MNFISPDHALREAAPSEARSAGDAARDRRDWLEAERCYRQHLTEAADDQPIWIQLGHALKEQGKLPEAEAAYRAGIALAPGLADPHFQLGHLLKLAGRRDAARGEYRETLRLEPHRGAHAELVALGEGALADALLLEWQSRQAADCVYLEITDLLVYLHDHTTASGIQRVQLGLIQHVLQDLGGEARAHYAFAMRKPGSAALWVLPGEAIGAILRHLGGAEVSRAALTTLLDAAIGQAVAARPGAGQSVVVLGAFWVGGDVVPAYAALKAAGLRIGAYIYDLIPLTHPEFCDARLVAEFTRALGEGLAFFDFLLAISEHTAAELRRVMAQLGAPEWPVVTVPLAHDFRSAGQRALPARWTPPIAPLRGREFVLCVCTIEVRKNHGYLFALWKQLLEAGGPVPELVLVGRFGWRVDDLAAQMEATGYLGGRIRVLHDLTDGELATLYDACLFTIFPSFVEGWGLPVGESLAHGKLCVASHSTSIPEVGGDLASYIDPHNLHSGLEAVRALLADRAGLAAREARIRAEFRPRDWAEVGQHFLASVDALVAAAQASPPRPAETLLRQGEIFRPAAVAPGAGLPVGYLARPLRLALAEGWESPGPDGAWVGKAEARLRFRTDAPAGAEVIVHLELRAAEVPAGAEIRLRAATGAARRVAVPGGSRLGRSFPLRLRAVADAEGVVELTLAWRAPATRKPKGALPMRLALVSLSHVAAANHAGRIELLEQLLLDQPEICAA